jgi:hypothetical protein
MSWIGKRMAGVPEDTSVMLEMVTAAEHAVALAGALFPGRARCLEQSLVLYYVLRQQGVAVRYHQGIQPHPFEAHAWLEYRGEPINDVAEHVKLFSCLPALLP